MKKKQIIQKEIEFTEIIKKCPYKKNSYFVIYYRPNKEQNRFGISVPKKTGKAHNVVGGVFPFMGETPHTRKIPTEARARLTWL